MAIQELSDDLHIISPLSDEPNDVDGLSAQELKKRFDKSGLLIQQYINEALLPGIAELSAELRADTKKYTDEVAQGFTLGQLSPGSVTNAMLANPILKTVIYFDNDSWVKNGDTYELVIPYEQHGLTVPFTYNIAHNIDGVYHNNTMVANSVCIYRRSNNDLLLVGDAAFAGRLVIIS